MRFILIGEIYRYAELESARVKRIIGSSEIIIPTKQSLIHMGEENIESSLTQAHVYIKVAEGIVAQLGGVLIAV